MQLHRWTRSGLIALSAAGALAAGLSAATLVGAQTTTPIAANGQPVEVVTNYVETPTSFAWGDGTLFIGKGPSLPNFGPGGLVSVENGVATGVPNGPADVTAWPGRTARCTSRPA